ncbi:MAG: GNAT family N-acetyltransferase [Candidatus Hodarchaeota archaeon]
MLELNELIKLSKKHIQPAILVLSRAFQNDPVLRWQIPDANKRLAKLHYFWELILRIGTKYGEVYGTSENLEGIAIWRPPENVNISYWKYIVNGGYKFPFKFGIKTTKRITFVQALNQSIRNIYMKNPHWYLEVIGVDPKYQGKGFARKLLKPMLRRIDNENLPTWLETNLERNLLFYEHFEFTIREELIIPNTNIVNFFMIRQSES